MKAVFSVFEFKNYREFLKTWLNSHDSPRGKQAQLASAAGVSSTLMSLILKEDKHLTLEQASDLCDYFLFSDREADYFLTIVSLGRAGSPSLKKKLLAKILDLQKQSQKLSHRIKRDVELTDSVKATYYSSWLPTAIMNLVAIDKFRDAKTIADHLRLPIERVTQAISFLREHQLILDQGGHYTYGTAHTHIGSESPFVNKHHQNWRMRGLIHMEERREQDLFYTCPMSLSTEAAEQVRNMLPTFIETVLEVVRPSPSERVACLNIDWFGF